MDVSKHTPLTVERNISKNDGTSLERESDSSDDNIIVRGRGTKQYRRNLTDSESDNDVENKIPIPRKPSIKNDVTKSRIKKISDSDSDSSSPTQSPATISRVSRVENKRIKLHEKFKKLVTPQANTFVDPNQTQVSDNESSGKSDGEISCLKIRKKIMKKKSTLSNICDADTSDIDQYSNLNIKKQSKDKSKQKSATEIQPRMSAKQAMENMQKIKSVSNRMLREKDVSLPYHKPRALCLQDVINRKKPTLTSDGKAMPIKMNSEQLAQYAKLLEERQQEIIELCKSESEEEADPGAMNIENENSNNNKVINDEIQDHNKRCDGHFDVINEGKEEATVSNTITIETTVFNETDNDNKKLHNSDALYQGNKKTYEDMKVSNTDIIIETKIYNEKLSEKNVDENIQGNNEAKENNIFSIETDTIGQNKPDSNDKIQISSINAEKSCPKSINLDSQLITLNFDSEKTENDERDCTDTEPNKKYLIKNAGIYAIENEIPNVSNVEREFGNKFSDEESDFNLEDIDSLIGNAEIIKDISNVDTCSTNAVTTSQSNTKPKLTGAPGMFIDLESGVQMPKLLTGVDLLKERFTYFSSLKCVEDFEKNKSTKHKPGTQHLKLKHELEEQIAEQRSLEWEKRLEEENQLKSEMNMEPVDEIEKIEAKLDKDIEEVISSSEDDDLVEDDVDMTDMLIKSNPMVDDEAEESNDEENYIEEEADDGEPADSDANDDSERSSCDDTSSESEDEQSKPKKGRILKAFEDSDDESNVETQVKPATHVAVKSPQDTSAFVDVNDVQDEEIQLAQLNRSVSEDIFATPGSLDVHQSGAISNGDWNKSTDDIPCTADLGSQTFSILGSAINNKEKQQNRDISSATQSIDETKFDSFNKVCSGSLSQNLLMSQPLDSQSQEIGDDIAALCTGKFYDNAFVTQIEEQKTCSDESNNNISLEVSMDTAQRQDTEPKNKEENTKATEDGNILKSILDELNEPEIENTNKFFVANQENPVKKKFVIDSDEDNGEGDNKERKKKFKKRKPEKRALQISDDEDDDEAVNEEEEESDIEEGTDKQVEYDSEENEIEIKAKPSKKKHIGEFFENEAELTSEDEWVGSGDEDEAGLDRLEREAGDSDVFHQGRLQRELGQIHMREVLDQDKREVRLLQELLFEDGDLGDGHRQRKFRWRTDADGDDEAGMGTISMTDTQEDEFESEELWRKQRHEREVFLKGMQENGDEAKANTAVNRTAMIKANLNSNIVSRHEAKEQNEAEPQPPVETKPTKDIPSPKKSFLILQQSYHGSLLSRGRGALARLAALATPLAADADAPRPKASSGTAGNFVFTTLSQPEPVPKVAKRKAETNASTPRLLKKLKTEETQKYLKNSLFDHFKT